MATSSVKVGRPLSGPTRRTRGELAWVRPGRFSSGQAASRPLSREAAFRLRAGDSSVDIALAAPDMVVPALSSLSLRQFLTLAGLGTGLVLLILGLVISSHLAVSHSYDLSDLIQQKIGLVEVNRQLKTELARVSSLDQLEVVARETLSLVTPRPGQIVVID